MDQHHKVLKLVLRFIATALREQGVFEAASSAIDIPPSVPTTNMKTVEALTDILQTLAVHSW